MPNLTIKQLYANEYTTCAIAGDDHVYCWGLNASGQVGDGTIAPRFVPTATVQGARPDLTATQIATGYNHTCAIASDNQAYCWGRNDYGQTGIGTAGSNVLTPTAIMQGDMPDLTVKYIVASQYHTCAISSNDWVYCWGDGFNGQLGNGLTGAAAERHVPTTVLQGEIPNMAVLRVTSDYSHTCVADMNEQHLCWGSNSYGQLGNGTAIRSLVPVAVSQGAMPSQISKSGTTGYYHTCSISAVNHQLYCWGRNNYGQVGDGTLGTNRLVPVAVDTFITVTIGGATCTNVIVVSNTELTCITPAHAAGLVDVSVTTFNGETQVLPQSYEYFLFRLGTITPDVGPTTGDQKITITGIGLSVEPIIAITLGSASCINVTVVSDTEMTCITTAHTAGLVDVSVVIAGEIVIIENGYTYRDVNAPSTGYYGHGVEDAGSDAVPSWWILVGPITGLVIAGGGLRWSLKYNKKFKR
jgi:alpha-tubulin suppressor-like RCC1 family protein